MIRPLEERSVQRGLQIEAEFLQAWLRATGLEERLFLAFDRLPPQPQALELWDLWLELQAALLRSRLPEGLEETLGRRLQELGGGSVRVWASLPAGSPGTLQSVFPGLRGTGDVLEAVRLAWAAVLCAVRRPEELSGPPGFVVVQLEEPASGQATASPADRGGLPAPDPSLLRLGELHGRLLLPDSPQRLQSLLDLGAWAPGLLPDEAEEKELLRAAEASGARGVAELLRRARQSWLQWVESPAAGAVPVAPDEPGASRAGGRHRQIAGSPGAPGLAAGPARVLRSQGQNSARRGEVLVCPVLPPRLSEAARPAAALVTEAGGRLSYGTVLAARAGIPCVCGARGAAAMIQDGDTIFVDGQLGIVGIRPEAKKI